MAEAVDQPITLRQWVDVMRRARLGRTTKAVALMLATYADNDGTRVFPGVARLSVDCELTYNVVQGALKALRDAGLIQVVRRAARRGRADEYCLILAPDVLDRVDVLTPAQVGTAAVALADRRRGRYRPTTTAGGVRDEERLDGVGEGRRGVHQLDLVNLAHGAPLAVSRRKCVRVEGARAVRQLRRSYCRCPKSSA
jgi:hypothetical protein